MNHEHVGDLSAGYVLDALDEGERERVGTHVRLCVSCQIAVASDRAIVEQLSFAAPQYRPAPHVKARLMERMGQEGALSSRTRSTSWPVAPPGERRAHGMRLPVWLMAAALVPWVVMLGLGIFVVASPRNEPSHALVVVTISGPNGEFGRLAMVPAGTNAFVLLTHMLALPPGKTYVCWLERKGQMEHACTFDLLKNSDDATLVLHTPRTMDSYTVFGVTMEANPHQAQPTGPLLATARL